MQTLQTTFEILSVNTGMKEWHMRPNHSILFRQKLETCCPWDHAAICRVIIQTIPCSPFLWPRLRTSLSSISNTAWTLSLPTYFITSTFKMDADFNGNISNRHL